MCPQGAVDLEGDEFKNVNKPKPPTKTTKTQSLNDPTTTKNPNTKTLSNQIFSRLTSHDVRPRFVERKSAWVGWTVQRRLETVDPILPKHFLVLLDFFFFWGGVSLKVVFRDYVFYFLGLLEQILDFQDLLFKSRWV